MRNLTVTLIALVAVLGGFYVGAKVGENRATASAASTTSTTGAGLTGAAAAAGTAAGGGGGAGGTAGAGGGSAFGSATSGQIIAVGNGTITILDRTGKQTKVNIGSARIAKSVAGTPADLTQGLTVTVVGPAGSGGAIDASVVSIGRGGFGGGGGGGGSGAASPSPAG